MARPSVEILCSAKFTGLAARVLAYPGPYQVAVHRFGVEAFQIDRIWPVLMGKYAANVAHTTGRSCKDDLRGRSIAKVSE